MDLFPHNREAYDSAVKLFKKENRVCVIRPTGTGKSLIIAEFINRHSSARHLLLAPGAHILSEIQKHVKGVEISFSTYIGVKTNPSLVTPHSFDFIYLDEFHRLGADVWGDNVDRLLQINPTAKVLGTSATPIRYLDDNRNMATEIFGDRIATQMSLNSAIAGGILPTPVYVSALYSVKDELRDLKQKIRSSDSKGKEAMIRELDSKVIDWQRSSGLDVVLKKRLSPNRRRVIVFCKDWNHLKYAQIILDPIFKEIYGTVKCISIYSKKKESENEAGMKAFSGEGRQAVVLYTIDKVNEGLHSRKCNTVILLRGTISPIVFYQQIGRAFSIGAVCGPLIIDLVNNFRNVNLVPFKREFEKELNASGRNTRSSTREQIKKSIEFIDETQDIREIFLTFEERIDNWMVFYKRAKQFYEEHGHSYVPHGHKELYNWVRIQRNRYKRKEMAKEHISLLNAIGIEANNDIKAQWYIYYYELKKWIKEMGRIPTEAKNSVLASWILVQRKSFNHGKLTEEQINLLQPLIPLGGNRLRSKIEVRLERLIAHFKNGNIHTADRQVKKDFDFIRNRYLQNRLRGGDLTYLREGNVPIESNIYDIVWLNNIKRTIAWYKTKGDLPRGKENSTLYNFWLTEEKCIDHVHSHAKLISLSKDAEQSVKELQRIISEVRRSRTVILGRPKSIQRKASNPRRTTISKRA
jgi:type I site-specific restriction endonuclease